LTKFARVQAQRKGIEEGRRKKEEGRSPLPPLGGRKKEKGKCNNTKGFSD
jgi:hypothetical protein